MCKIHVIVIIVLTFLVVTACVKSERHAVASEMVGGYAPTAITEPGVMNAAREAVALKNAELHAPGSTTESQIQLIKIISAAQQVVAGVNYALSLVVSVDGTEQTVDTVVWWQAWNEKTPYRVTSWCVR